MPEPKKIKVKKPVEQQPRSKQDALKILENTVKKLTNRFNQYGFNDSKEEDFFQENKGKEMIIELPNQEIEGVLESLDKYRIGVKKDGKLIYFYKHAIVGYYAK